MVEAQSIRADRCSVNAQEVGVFVLLEYRLVGIGHAPSGFVDDDDVNVGWK